MENKGKKTIGLFIDWIDGPFQFQMLEGIEEGAKKFGVNLYCFAGGAVKSPNKFESVRNFIYDYATPGIIDGLVIMATPVGVYCTIDELNRFRKIYERTPVVSIAQELENSYTLRIDNNKGLKAIVNHLIKHHGYKKIAVIKGPENNTEASARFKTIMEVLKENAIRFEENMAAPGFFTEKSGYDSTMKLLETNKKIEAIVAVNDDMAYGSIRALKEMKLSVPFDIAVVGFDDQLQSKLFSPPLSTVRMPTAGLGFKAVELLNDLFMGKSIEKITVLSTEPVIRESCGCMLETGPEIENWDGSSYMPGKFEQVKNTSGFQTLENYMKKTLRRYNIGFTDDEIIQLAGFFISSVKERNSSTLLYFFSMLMNKNNLSESDMDTLLQYFLYLKENMTDFFEAEEDKEFLDHYVRLIISYIYDFMRKNLNFAKIKLEREVVLHRFFVGELFTSANREEIIENLLRELPELNISTFYLSLFDEENSKNLELILAYRNKQPVNIPDRLIFNPMETVVPEKYLDSENRWSLIVEPIFFGTVGLGLAVFDINAESYIYYIMHRRILMEALNNTVFLQSVLKGSRNLEKANNELSRTLEMLKETQEKLIQSEKMSALGGLVAGISHEINTPLGISVTAASHLDRITKDLSELYNSKNMKRSDFEKYLSTARETSDIILNNLKRGHELIMSFKQVAVDQFSEEKRKFNISQYINQTLLSLKPALKKAEHNVEVNCPAGLEIYSYPGALYQILTNFIMNSIIHAYDKGAKGNILIELTRNKNNIVLKYSDDGKGISRSIIDKIYDPFFTTNRGHGGTGLGLHIVYNLVAQKLNGSIKCESAPGRGTAFTVIFPAGPHDA